MKAELVGFVVLGVCACTCTKEGDTNTAVADAAVDAGRDVQHEQHGERPLWPLDIGPIPDANTALCKDAWFPDATSVLDSKVPLAVKPEIKFKTLLAKGTFSAGSAPLLGPDGNIHILIQQGLFGISPDGQVKWSVSPPVPSFGFGTNPLGINGKWLVFGTDEGIYGVSRTGAGDWLVPFKGTIDPAAPPGSDVTSAPALDGKGNVLIAGPDHLLYRIDGKGSLVGTSQLPGRAWGMWHPVVDAKGNTYLRLRGAYERVALISNTGKTRWTRLVLPGTGILAMSIGANGDLVVAALQEIKKPQMSPQYVSHLMSLDQGCGAERWRTTLDGSAGFPILVGPSGELFLMLGGNKADKLVSLTSQGKPRWSTDLENSGSTGFLGFAAVGPLGADGAIYTLIKNDGPKGNPSGPPQVRAYAMADGKELWKLSIAGMSFTFGYPLLRTDGMLIFGANFPNDPVPGFYLVGVQTPSPGLALAPWPRARHDNQSSGNVVTKLP